MADSQDNTTLTVGSNQVVHLDLFSGIGGFAYAIDQVWDNVTHIFCDNEPFAQKVLAKHWPESEIYSDIRTIIKTPKADIVTGGFPCQPFSQAGKKKGTADNRYLWPEMLRVIRMASPTWVIAENVSGLINWNDGLVLERICTDLEAEGYDVQPFIIPAVAVNAPHKRERIWFVAHAEHLGRDKAKTTGAYSSPQLKGQARPKLPVNEPARTYSLWPTQTGRDRWDTDWPTVAASFCGVDDGLPDRVDRIKSLGNAIVPQVAEQLIRGIDLLLKAPKPGAGHIKAQS